MNHETAFKKIALAAPGDGARAPASLKARLYTRLVHTQQASGPLETVKETKRAGHGLCVFEELVQIAPVGSAMKSKFYCDVCHARVLAERMDAPPIWWPNCPYAAFKQA